MPQLFILSGATKFGDPKNYPWTMNFQLSYQAEAAIYARHVLQTKPDAKIAVLYQNDDFGRDLLKGLKDGLGAKAATMIVSEVTYEASDPTVDSQIVTMNGSGADVFMNFGLPKTAAQAIRKIYDIGWKPVQYLLYGSSSVASTLTPAGLDKSAGLISAQLGKDVTDKQWDNDPGMRDYRTFMAKYYPDGNATDGANAAGYSLAILMVHVLKQCGDNLTRENVMRQAASLKNLHLPLELPGMHGLTTSPTDYFPVKQVQLARFDGKSWVRFGDVLGN